MKGELTSKQRELIRNAARAFANPTGPEERKRIDVVGLLARIERARQTWAEYGFPLTLLDDCLAALRSERPDLDDTDGGPLPGWVTGETP